MVKYSDPIDFIFYGLSHPVRREILNLVRAKEYLVTELAAHFDLSLAAVSKHIKVLERADLVKREKQGRLHSIHLKKETLLTAEEWLVKYRTFWEQNFDQLESYLETTKK